MVSKGLCNASVPEHPSSLSRQGSLYSLTLDEVQNQLENLGKPLGSMNIDELLRTVWTAEAIDNGAPHPTQLESGSPLNKQSSFSLSRDLSKKTVEEVWREIQQGARNKNDGERNQERQHTLGEMTLEDFLAQAGVVVESGSGGAGRNISSACSGFQYKMLPQQQANSLMPMYIPSHHVQQQPITANGGPLGLGESAYLDISMSPSTLIGTLSDTQAPGRKRVAPGDVVEKTVERRQKRMIKNRESAARSRARKQAYTHELENKVSRLERENERLRRMKEVEKILPSAPPPEPKYQLRRTSSAPL